MRQGLMQGGDSFLEHLYQEKKFDKCSPERAD